MALVPHNPSVPNDSAPPLPLSTRLTVEVPFRVLALPPKAPAAGPVPVLVGLHGYAQNADLMLKLLALMAPDTFLLVAVEGPHGTLAPGKEIGPKPKRGYHWGIAPDPTDTRAAHRTCVAKAIDWASGIGGDPARISLAGFSQPCSLNLRLALAPPHGQPFRSVLSFCGGLPGEWMTDEQAGPATEASRATAAYFVSTTADPFYSVDQVKPFGERLARRFGPTTHAFHEGAHRIPLQAFDEARAFLGTHG